MISGSSDRDGRTSGACPPRELMAQPTGACTSVRLAHQENHANALLTVALTALPSASPSSAAPMPDLSQARSFDGWPAR